MNVNTMIRQPGPATIKGNIVLGRPKPGSRPHTIVFCAEMFVGAATSAQVCGLLMFYNGEGATYPEAGYYNIESTFFFFDLENINAGFTQNDMLFYDFFGEIETLTYICPIDAPSPFFNRFTRMVMAAGGVATNCQRSAPWQFHLDIVGYSSDWKSSTTEKPATHILAKFTEQGRFRKQLAKNEAPPFPYPKRFVHVRGPIIDVVFDPVLRHPNGTPRVRRWVLDIASIHFFGSFNESNGSGISTIPNTLDCAATNAGSAHPRSFLNLGPSSLTPPSAAEPSAPTGPQFPATPFSSNQQWGVTYFQGATPYGAPSSAGPSNSSHVQAMPAGTGSVTHSGLPSSDQPTYGQPSVAPAPPPSMQAQPSFAPGPSQPTYSQPTGVPAPPPSTQAQPSFAPAPPMQASSHFSFAPPPSAQAQTAPAPPPSMQTHGFSFAPAQQTQGLSFAPAQQTQGYPSFIAAPGPLIPPQPQGYASPATYYPMTVVPAPQSTSLASGLTNQYPSPFLPFPSSSTQLGTAPTQNTAGGATSATTFASPAQTQATTPTATQAQSTATQPANQTPTQAPPTPAPTQSQPQAPAPAPTFPAPPAPMSQSQNRTPQPPAPRQTIPAPVPAQSTQAGGPSANALGKRALRSNDNSDPPSAAAAKRSKGP